MDWVMVFSLMWVVNGAPQAPTVWTTVNFQSEELCVAAVAKLKDDMAAAVADGIQTYAQGSCVLRKQTGID